MNNNTPHTISKTACYHCGEPCNNTEIQLDELSFCCHGCKTVYQILADNNLTSFYDQFPGQAVQAKQNTNYDFLKNTAIARQLIDFQTDNIATIILELPQIHCSACIWILERLFRFDDGILSSKVNYLKKECTIVFDINKIDLFSLANLLQQIGYGPEFNLNNSKEEKKRFSKSNNYKIGLAGFCFGNIMLLSFPEYMSSPHQPMFTTFGYLKILLALPVLLYAGKDYLLAAKQFLLKRNIGIDLPIAIGMITLFSRSVFEILSGIGEGYLDSFAGFVFLLLIGKWFQEKTYSNIAFDRDYTSFFPISVLRKEADGWDFTAIDQLKSGDIIRVRNEEILPCDSKLLAGNGRIDYSFVTGESKLQSTTIHQNIFAGGKIVGGFVEAEVIHPVAQSRLTQLWNDDVFQKSKDIKEKSIIDFISKYFVFIIIGIAVIGFFYWLPIDIGMAFNVLTSVLIIACPCVLALSIPFIYGNGIRQLSKWNIFLKNTDTLFRLQEIDNIVFDKTGTLTDHSKMQVTFSGISLDDQTKNQITSLCRLSAHPLSQAIVEFLKSGDEVEVNNFSEFPGQGIQGTMDNNFWRLGSEKFILGHTSQTSISRSYIEFNGDILGYFSFEQKLKGEMKNIIENLKTSYILGMTSGDPIPHPEIDQWFAKCEKPLYNQSPQDKLRHIDNLIQQGYSPMMVGDGLNDSGALKQSNVGVVVNHRQNNFTPAADIVVNDEALILLPQLLEYAQWTRRILYGGFVIAALYNGIGLYFALKGLLSPLFAAVLMPLSSITIVVYGFFSINILTQIIFPKNRNDHSHSNR
ncbi:heavy metal translocating P-type ATPase [Membranihabitans marinus]|uniref:heavy metal translocating P-type ATPase n=1 Tax=Membranihabitans marinus TaxID=1227546 RepID=UPI001F3264A6|nr:heavy metal translocating P-type ATPase metal-binding domain-containing protein [Membranihabitans marinus]